MMHTELMIDQSQNKNIIRQITELINSGDFPPGSKLPSERKLASLFGVSRNFIRDTKIALHAQGIIEIRPNVGAYVRNGASSIFPTIDCFELTEASVVFGSEVAALAASMITQEEISKLESYVAILSGDIKSEMSLYEANLAFHTDLSRSTKNSAIIFFMESLWCMHEKSSKLKAVFEVMLLNNTGEHKTILDAIKNKDPQAARQAMQAHLSNMTDMLFKYSEEKAYENVRRNNLKTRLRFLLAK